MMRLIILKFSLMKPSMHLKSQLHFYVYINPFQKNLKDVSQDVMTS